MTATNYPADPTIRGPVVVPVQTAAMTSAAAPPLPRALAVACPICAAPAGQPCEDVVAGWIVAAAQPHLSRVAAAVDPAGARRRGGAR